MNRISLAFFNPARCSDRPIRLWVGWVDGEFYRLTLPGWTPPPLWVWAVALGLPFMIAARRAEQFWLTLEGLVLVLSFNTGLRLAPLALADERLLVADLRRPVKQKRRPPAELARLDKLILEVLR